MGRAPCCDKDGLKKGPWLPEEDQKLIDYIQKHGPGNWRTLPKKAGLQRCGKSCRLRWTNYLRPDIKRGRFSFEEEEAIIQLHSILGNKWSAIAAKLPGRTDNEIKNYWNTHIRKRLLRMGIDPVTHTRRLDLLDLPFPSSIFNSPIENNHSNDQLNFLNLLGLQSLMNPDLLSLATLLSTNNQNQKLAFLLNNLQQNKLSTNANQMQNHFNPISETPQNASAAAVSTSAYGTVIGDDEVREPNLDQYPTHNSTFDAQNCVNQWQNNVGVTHDCNNNNGVQTSQSLNLTDDQQAFLDRWLGNSAWHSNNSNQSLCLPSLFSSPCSSQQQTPNSTYPNSSSSSEDEIDSYCENLMNFDIPVDFFDVCKS